MIKDPSRPALAASIVPPPVVARRALWTAVWTIATVLVVWSAIRAKEGRGVPPLAQVATVPLIESTTPRSMGVAASAPVPPAAEPWAMPAAGPAAGPGAGPAAGPTGVPAATPARPRATRFHPDPNLRWFDGRPVRPIRTMWMTVTAYSPDWRSCGDSDDGLTATLHHVTTNGHKLVAADPRVLPFGSMISIPGYDQGRIVPVLDRGGAIRGRRLDVLFPTHEEAMQWGVRRIRVTIWGYADGRPMGNPRLAR